VRAEAEPPSARHQPGELSALAQRLIDIVGAGIALWKRHWAAGRLRERRVSR
jgi:hypothetical protein